MHIVRCGMKRQNPAKDERIEESNNLLDEQDELEPPTKRLKLQISATQQQLEPEVPDQDDLSMDGAISTTNDILLCLNKLNIFPIHINAIIGEYSET